jgi:hypothetical protein
MRTRELFAILTISVLVACSQGTETSDQSQSVELPFWAGPNARTDARTVRLIAHHACSGEIAIARVDRMPPATQKDPFEPERVLEYGSEGNVLRRWAMPVDSVIAAISDDSILVPSRDARLGAPAWAISTTGALKVATVPAEADFGHAVECPRLALFGESEYVRCFEFADLASKQIRRLAYQGPCT